MYFSVKPPLKKISKTEQKYVVKAERFVLPLTANCFLLTSVRSYSDVLDWWLWMFCRPANVSCSSFWHWPRSMRSSVYLTVWCPPVCLSVRLSVPLHQQRSSFDTGPQHVAQQQMRAVPCLQPRDEVEHRLVCSVDNSLSIVYAYIDYKCKKT